MNVYDTSAREIKSNAEWKNDHFIQNESFKPKLQSSSSPVTFYNEIPAPLLKTALEKFGKGNKEKQQNIVQAIWVLLFGEGTTTTMKPATNKPTPAPPTSNSTNTPGTSTNDFDKKLDKARSFDPKLITRTRRTTKNKVEGNCKNPPKKHKDTEYDEDV